MKVLSLLNAFNRGIISRLALARTDLKRTALSAEIQSNWMTRALGSMMLRPGFKYISNTFGDNFAAHIPFIFSIDDTAIIELTNGYMRVRVDDTVISRPSVSTTITNGNFDADAILGGWTDADESGASSAWVAGNYMGLTGTKFNSAVRTQTVSVTGGNLNVEHGIRVVIYRGEVTLKIGSTSGGDEYVRKTLLKAGTYSFGVTPSTDMYIRLESLTQAVSLVQSVTIEVAGDMAIPTEWLEANLPYVRHDTSGDVVFVACDGVKQKRIERRATRSWGIADYIPKNGPLRTINTSTTTLSPSANTGDITVTASQNLFYPSMVGGIFAISSIGQNISASISGADQWSESIKVTGVGESRRFSFVISGVWSGTVRVQSSVGDTSSWADIATLSWTGNTSGSHADGLDNQIVYYRIGIKSGEYTSGTATITIAYASGSIRGFVRLTGYNSPTSVTASVIQDLGGTAASSNWAEGEWSDYRGYPSAVAFDGGRLWWAGRDKIIASVSDGFENFDDTTEGDSAPINRTIGSGAVDKINWLLSLSRLMVGAELSEKSARSSSLDEPLTATNFNLKTPSTRGSSAVAPVKIDNGGLFVRLNRLFELAYNETYSSTSDYGATDLTMLAPEIGSKKFTKLAVQRYPDTRVHCIRDDGQVAAMIFDRAEDVKCWLTIDTDGEIEDAFVMPAQTDELEDSVYYVVKRTVNGATKRFLEKWAFESECAGGTTTYGGVSAAVLDAEYPDGTVVTLRDSSGTKIGNNLTVTDNQVTVASAVAYATITPSLYKLADSHVVYSGVATTTFTAAHLPNAEVVIWGDGKDLGTFTLDASGQCTIPSVETYMGGLYYRARYKSSKLAYGAQMGTALTQRKRLNSLGCIFVDTHAQGLKYGPDFDNLDNLPLMEDEVDVDADYIWQEYDKQSFEFAGDYDTDSRVCLQAESPKPCNLLALVLEMQTYETG